MKRKSVFFGVLILMLAACQPPEVEEPPQAEQPLAWVTPQVGEGMAFLDVCTHMVSYPGELSCDGSGILMEDPDDPETQVYFSSRRRFESEAGEGLDAIAAHVATEYAAEDAVSFNEFPLVDFGGREVDARIGDAVMGDVHVQILVALVPDYFLMDQMKEDAIYYVVARAPEAEWGVWGPKFEAMFETFVPKECGGV